MISNVARRSGALRLLRSAKVSQLKPTVASSALHSAAAMAPELQRPPVTSHSEEEQAMRAAVSRFAEDAIKPHVQRMDAEGAMDKDILRQLFENGLMGVEVEEKYGGSEASFTSALITVEELARVDASIAVLCDIQNTLINNMFRFWASEELKEEWLPRLATDTIGSFCLSEAGSGSDAFSMKTTATFDEASQEYSITGSKMWISNAEHAGVFLVMANAAPEQGYKGITCFVVPAGTPGLEIGKPEKKLSIRSSSTCALTLDNVRVPKSAILGDFGKGYKYAIEILNEGRIGIGAQMLGIARGAYDNTMPYLWQREQFGTQIGEFQGMQHQYAEAAMDIEAARVLVYNAARMKEHGDLDFVKEAAMAKLFSSRTAERTASKCIEWLGGVGVTEDVGVEKFYRDCKIGAIYEGTSNIQLQTIAKIVKADYA